MTIGTIEKINITFNSDELSCIAFAINRALLSKVESHINKLQNDDLTYRKNLFIEQNKTELMMMRTFLYISGNPNFEHYKKEIINTIKGKTNV